MRGRHLALTLDIEVSMGSGPVWKFDFTIFHELYTESRLGFFHAHSNFPLIFTVHNFDHRHIRILHIIPTLRIETF